MSEAQQLIQVEQRLADLVALSARLADDPAVAANPAWKPLFDKARTQAKDAHAVARSPVKVGVVGVFSAGKTLLLGGLIGYADHLPVKEIATTGNVTALSFKPVEGLETTKVGTYRIDFLNHAEFVECLRYMLAQAVKRAKSSDLPEELRERLAAIKADDDAAPSQIDEWGRAAWGRTTNAALKYSIREVVRYVRAYQRFSAALCETGPSFEVPPETAVRGLELDAVVDDIHQQSFNDIPTPARGLASRPDALSADQIRDAFPLIRLVTVEVHLSKGVWDFAGLGAERFVLMDFPGLGADSSGVRDQFLCLREMEKIQTLLILLNGKTPGSDQGMKIVNLLQDHRPGQDIKDMVLVGVGRFDQLPLIGGDLQKLRDMGGVAAPTKKAKAGAWAGDDDEEDAPKPAPAAGPLAEAALLQALPILGSAVSGAQALVAPGCNDRIVFLSPLLHLDVMSDKNDGLEVWSKKFKEDHRTYVDAARQVQPIWKAVAGRLSPGKTLLPRWLGEFAEDGGVSRLRQLILSHVQGAGFAQLRKDVKLRTDALTQTLVELKRTLPPAVVGAGSQTPEDELRKARQQVKGLAEFYQGQLNELTRSQQLRLMRDEEALSLDDYLRKALPLDSFLHEEIVFRVAEWPLWEQLMEHSEEGLIRERTAEARPKLGAWTEVEDDEDVDWGKKDEDAAPFPTTSDNFLVPFEQTLEQLKEFGCKLIDRSVAEYLGQLEASVEGPRAALEPALTRRGARAALNSLGLLNRTEGLVGILLAAVRPKRLVKGLFRIEPAAEEEERPESAQDVKITARPAARALFPLAIPPRESQSRVFGWAAKLHKGDKAARPDDKLSHRAMVLRLRDEFVRMLRQELSQQLNERAAEVIKELKGRIETVMKRVAEVSSSPIVLDALITGRPATAAGEAVDALIDFRRLASETFN